MEVKGTARNDKGELTLAMIDGRGFVHGSILDSECAMRNREIERLRNALNTIARRCAPSTRTFDQMMRDMTLSCDVAREALAHEQPVEPHAYVPSHAHMGDCAVCGNLQGNPLHSPFRRTVEQSGSSQK